jgi:hypothetical protein
VSTLVPERGPAGPDPEPLPPEPDRIPWGVVGLVAVLSLVVFLIGCLWATWILHSNAGWVKQSLAVEPREIGKPTVGIVDQRIFEQELRAEQLRLEGLRRLSSYGWVDRERRLVHLPVERAMELMLEEGR